MKGKPGVKFIRAIWGEFKKKVSAMLEGKKVKLNDLKLGDPAQDQNIEKEEELAMGMDKKYLAELGLAENAKDEDVVAAFKKVGAARVALLKAIGVAENATDEAAATFITELKAKGTESKQFSDRVAALESANKKLLHDSRVTFYLNETKDLVAISGKSEDLANDLVGLEEKAGPETAAKVLATYKEQNKALIATGVFKVKGTPAAGGDVEDHEFTKAVKAYRAKENCDEPTAFAAVRKSQPDLFRKFQLETRKKAVELPGGSDEEPDEEP